MSLNRRTFLGVAGLSAIAFGGRASFGAPARAAERVVTQPGTRWAMVVDPEKCRKAERCTDCIAACDVAHNVPRVPERPHEVKWIWKEPFAAVFPDPGNAYAGEAFRNRPVPVLCNHCDHPPCVQVCPTKATWKRQDGIVMMDWHRCIGCRYCVAACPYGSRSFNWRDPRPHIAVLNPGFPTRTKGVVEKCNFCEERLAKGEPPACVAACPEKAMVFGNLEDPRSAVRHLLQTRYAIRRKPELGTGPEIYYLV